MKIIVKIFTIIFVFFFWILNLQVFWYDIEYKLSNENYDKSFNEIIYIIKNLKNRWFSDIEIEQRLNTIMNNNYMTRNTYSDLNNYYNATIKEIESVLNNQELKLFRNNKIKWFLAVAAWKAAFDESVKYYNNESLHNWNWDAFRHMLWNYYMYQEVWEEFAKIWSDAHEYWEDSNPKIEQLMDLYNNAIWRKLWKEKKYILKKTAIEYTRESIRKWRWLRIHNWRYLITNWKDDL